MLKALWKTKGSSEQHRKPPKGVFRLFFQVSQSERIIDMSRYSATTTDGLEMAFGYDRPLQEYFLCVYDESDELIADFSSSGNSMVRPHPPMSNSKILDLIRKTMCEQDRIRYTKHLDSIAMDLPF
jgi:hypothetical protein